MKSQRPLHDSKYIFVELDWRNGKLRIGSCFIWSVVLIVLGLSGHLSLSGSLSGLLEWLGK